MSQREAHEGKRQRFEREAMGHLDAMYGAALRLTRDPKDAEDLVQEAMLRAYRFWDNYDADTNCKAWLLRVLTNVYFNEYKRAQRRHQVHTAAGTEQATTGQVLVDAERDTHRDPETRLVEASLSDEVAAALDQLPAEFRAAITLCDLHGLSYQETAEALGCPVGTVMSRLFRGRKLLRQQLGGFARAQGVGESKVVRLDDFRGKRAAAKQGDS